MNLIQILITRNLDQKYKKFMYNYTHFSAGRLTLKPLFMPRYYSLTIELSIGHEYDKTRKID